MAAPFPDPAQIALGIRQPWVELILRGVKTIEIRSQNTQIRGPIYIYASQKPAESPAAVEAARRHGLQIDDLPRGVLVGSVEIHATAPTRPGDTRNACLPAELLEGKIGWHLRAPVRFEASLPVRFLPYGVWFYPFRRRHADNQAET